MKRFRKFASNKNSGKIAKDKGEEEEEESLEWIVSGKTLKGSNDPITTKNSENLQSFNDVASIPKKKVTDLEIRKNFLKKLKKSTDGDNQEINENVDKFASSKKFKKRKHPETFVSYVETNDLGNNEYKPMRKFKKQKMGVDNPEFDVEGNLSIDDDNETPTVNNNEFELKTKKKYKHFDKQGIDNPALNDSMTTNAPHTKRKSLNTSSDRIFRPSDWIDKSTNEHVIPKPYQFKSTYRKGYNETPYQTNKGFVNNGFATRATEIFGNPSNETSNLNENIKTISNTIDRYHAEVENDINEAKIDHYEENLEINTNYGEEDMLVDQMRMQKRPTPNVYRQSRGRFNNNYYNQNNQFRNTNMNANDRFSYDNTNRRFSNQHVNRRSGPITPQTRNVQNFIHQPKVGNQRRHEFSEGYDANQQYVDETNDFQQEGFYPNQYQHEEFHQNNFQQQQFYPNDYQQQGFNPNHFEEEFQPNHFEHEQFQEDPVAHEEEFYRTDFNDGYNTSVQYNEQPNNNFVRKNVHPRGFSHGNQRHTAVKQFDKPTRSFETKKKPYTQKQDVLVGDVDSSLEHHETVDEGTKLSFKQAKFTASQPWTRKEGNYAKKSYKHLIKGDVVVGFKDANLHEIKGYAAHKKVAKY